MPLVPVPLGHSASVVVGEPVAAIGSPLGNLDSLAVGIVSAVHRSIAALTNPRFQLTDAIQTDAPIAHGSSGGPLLDARRPRDRDHGPDPHRSGRGRGNRLRRSDRLRPALPARSADKRTHQLRLRRRPERGPDAVAGPAPPAAGRARRARGYRQLQVGRRRRPVCGEPRARSSSRARPSPSGGDVIVAVDGRPVEDAADLVRIVTTLAARPDGALCRRAGHQPPRDRGHARRPVAALASVPRTGTERATGSPVGR